MGAPAPPGSAPHGCGGGGQLIGPPGGGAPPGPGGVHPGGALAGGGGQMSPTAGAIWVIEPAAIIAAIARAVRMRIAQ